MKKVTVVGSGIAGLSLAYYLQRKGASVQIFTSDSHVGGMIQSRRSKWGLVESAANAFVSNQEVERISEEIFVELCPTLKESKARYIYRNKPRRWSLSWTESMLALTGWVLAGRKRRPHAGESIKGWSDRVLGEATTQYLVAPALQGVYALSADKLSATLILNRFFDRKARPLKGKLRGSVAPRGGMQRWAEGLYDYLLSQGVSVRFNETVDTLEDPHLTRPIVVATPLRAAANILRSTHPQESKLLEKQRTVDLSSATAFFSEKTALKGFGVLFPREQGFKSLGVLFNSSIFPDRSENRSETWIYRGIHHDLEAQMLRDRERLYGRKSRMLGMKSWQWPDALPCYDLRLEKLLRSDWQKRLHDQGVFLHGNYLGNLGLGQIVFSSKALAEQILAR